MTEGDSRELWERGLSSAIWVLGVHTRHAARMPPKLFDFGTDGRLSGSTGLCPGDEYEDLGLGCRLDYVPAMGLGRVHHELEHLIDMSFANIVDITVWESDTGDDLRPLVESDMATQVLEHRLDICLALADYVG